MFHMVTDFMTMEASQTQENLTEEGHYTFVQNVFCVEKGQKLLLSIFALSND